MNHAIRASDILPGDTIELEDIGREHVIQGPFRSARGVRFIDSYGNSILLKPHEVVRLVARENPSNCPSVPGLIPCRNEQGQVEVNVVGWIALLALGAGAIWLTRSTSPPITQYVLQQRPIPPVASMSDASKRAATTIAQTQLKALGYHITTIDGISGPETQQAALAFIADHPEITRPTQQVAYDETPLISAIDNAYRARVGLPAAA